MTDDASECLGREVCLVFISGNVYLKLWMMARMYIFICVCLPLAVLYVSSR